MELVDDDDDDEDEDDNKDEDDAGGGCMHTLVCESDATRAPVNAIRCRISEEPASPCIFDANISRRAFSRACQSTRRTCKLRLAVTGRWSEMMLPPPEEFVPMLPGTTP